MALADFLMTLLAPEAARSNDYSGSKQRASSTSSQPSQPGRCSMSTSLDTSTVSNVRDKDTDGMSPETTGTRRRLRSFPVRILGSQANSTLRSPPGFRQPLSATRKSSKDMHIDIRTMWSADQVSVAVYWPIVPSRTRRCEKMLGQWADRADAIYPIRKPSTWTVDETIPHHRIKDSCHQHEMLISATSRILPVALAEKPLKTFGLRARGQTSAVKSSPRAAPTIKDLLQ